MEYAEILQRLDGVKRVNDSQCMARCPAHDDKNASLAVSQSNGKVLLHCLAGCDTAAIVSALKLEMSDLFPEQKQPSGGAWEKLREHIYSNAQGGTFAKKTVYRKPDGKKAASWALYKDGQYIKGLDGKAAPLYKLPELIDSKDPVVFIPEGEKDVETLQRMELTATTTPDGAGEKWRQEYTPYFDGKRVIILTDNDEAGRKHGQTVAGGVKTVAKSVQIIPTTAMWTDAPEKADISDIAAQFGIDEAKSRLMAAAADTPAEEKPKRRAKAAIDFGADNTRFEWFPYLPKGDYSVLMADGGTGKTIFCCGVAAAISCGRKLPGDVANRKPERVLIISAEDTGEMLKKRLVNSDADLHNVLIIDCQDSEGMNFTSKLADFEGEIKNSGAKLVIVDPWHAFLGEDTDINRVNAVRPVFQKLANVAKKCDCALVLISHVNKRAQVENANNAATGSTDFINASRSAMRIIFDEQDPDVRICIHTKTNYAAYGQSIRYRIHDGGLSWDGFSDITRATLEEAARKRTTVSDLNAKQARMDAVNHALIAAIQDEAPDCYVDGIVKMSYDTLKAKYSDDIFGNAQPKRALDSVAGELLTEHGIVVVTGKTFKSEGKTVNGFYISLAQAEAG